MAAVCGRPFATPNTSSSGLVVRSRPDLDLFGSQIQLQGDLIGAVQWRIYQGAAKEFGSCDVRQLSLAAFSFPTQRTRSLPGSPLVYLNYTYYINILEDAYGC